VRVIAPLLLLVWSASAAELSVTNIRLQQYEDGPSVGSSYAFRPRETVFLSFNIAGFQATEGEEHKINLAYTIDAMDAQGLPLAKQESGSVAVELLPEDKDWLPKVRYNVQLPEAPAGGTYEIVVKVKDAVASAQAIQQIPFQVDAPKIDLAAPFGIQGLRFYRSEEAENPLTESASYRVGDPVWVRFNIVGFKLGDKNSYDVRYGIAVRDPDDKQVFAQPNAAAEKGSTFYPRRSVPATLRIDFDKKAGPGKYTLLIQLEDNVGGQKAEQTLNFSLEK
jgi:hypothetical protein